MIVVDHQGATYATTLWPLADNRLVTQAEMAEVLRGIHDTPPQAEMPDCMQIRFERLKRWVRQLPSLPNPPPKDVAAKCQLLVAEVMSELELEMAAAPRKFLHGDAHPANIVIFKGRPVACNLDEICLGPVEVDLSMAFIQAERYPGADTSTGGGLATAYGRPYNSKLLRLILMPDASPGPYL